MIVFNLILFLLCSNLVLCEEYMPVLLWSTEPSKQHFTEVSAFSRISSNDFTDYILKKVKAEKPAIIVFMEDYLSVEDFSWRDDKGNLAFPHLKKISTTAKGKNNIDKTSIDFFFFTCF